MRDHILSAGPFPFATVAGVATLFPNGWTDGLLSDVRSAAFWVLANVLLVAGCWKASRRLFPESTGAELVIHILVLAWASVVSVLLFLGLVGLLTGSLAIVAVTILSTVIYISLRFGGRDDRSEFGEAQHGVAPRTALTRSEEAASHLAWARTVLFRPSSTRPAVWSLLLAFAIGHVLVNGLLVFPSDWDTLHYHLPMIDQWLQARSLCTPDCFHWSNPGTNELLGLWAVAPFSGDYFIALTNLPGAILLAAAVIGLGGEVGLSRPFAHLAGIAAVSNYVVLYQLLDAENDVAVAALFCASLFYGLRFLRSRRQVDLLFCSVLVGLLAGVKFYALGYAALVGGVLILFAALAWGPGTALRAGGVLMAGAVLFGGYWYLRNNWVSGSPLYPRDLLQAQDTLSRLCPAMATTSFLGNGRPELFRLGVEAVWRMTGPCHLLALLLLPVTLPYLALAGVWSRNPDYKVLRWARGAIVLLTAGAGTLLLVTPFAVEDIPGTLNQIKAAYCPVRYGLCFLTLSILGLAVVVQDGARGLRRLTARPALERLIVGLFAASCAVQLVFTDQRLPRQWADTRLVAVTFLLLAANAVLVHHLWPAAWTPLVVGFSLGAVAGFALFTGRLAATWHEGFADHYDRVFATKLYSRLAAEGPTGSRICVMRTQCYPFFGSARQFRVCQPVYTSSPEELRDYFRQHDVDYVAAPAGGFRREGWNGFQWFNELKSQHPGAFPAVWDEPVLSLYRRTENVSLLTRRRRPSNGQAGEEMDRSPSHSFGRIDVERP